MFQKVFIAALARLQVLEESESDYGDTPKAPSPKKKLVVSGGLTGFGIAQDLLQIDFSPPEEAPEEFKAVAFYEEPKQIKPGLSGTCLQLLNRLSYFSPLTPFEGLASFPARAMDFA